MTLLFLSLVLEKHWFQDKGLKSWPQTYDKNGSQVTLNGRRPKWKTEKMDDDQLRALPQAS